MLYPLFQLSAQDTLVLGNSKQIALIEQIGLYSPDLILGTEHQFRGNVLVESDSTVVKCIDCVYFFQTGEIAIELAQVDVEIHTNSNKAQIFFRKSYTETLIIPNKLKVQIIEMVFDVTNNQPALMNPKVTEEFMTFERSQLIYYNTPSDSTSWLAEKVKVDLKSGDIIFEGVEVFKPYGCEIIPQNFELKLDKKGNFYPLKNATMRFERYGDMHDIEADKIKFKKQSSWFKAKGYIEGKGEMHRITKIRPEKVGGIYQITGKVKGIN